MPQQFQQNIRKRFAVLVFLKNSVMPLVLYFENPEEEYLKFKELLKSSTAVPKLVEKETVGPVKKISLMSNQIAGVALQEEQIQVQ